MSFKDYAKKSLPPAYKSKLTPTHSTLSQEFDSTSSPAVRYCVTWYDAGGTIYFANTENVRYYSDGSSVVTIPFTPTTRYTSVFDEFC